MTDRLVLLRMVTVLGVMAAAWTGLALKLAVLHLGRNDEIMQEAAKIAGHRTYQDRLLALRGKIVDANQNTLAASLRLKDVVADPQTILQRGQSETLGLQLARILGLEYEEVMDRLNRQDRRYEVIQRRIGPDLIDRLERMKLPGIMLEDCCPRHYPHGALLCHVLGFMAGDGRGYQGVEEEFHDVLQGRAGLRVGLYDGRRHRLFDEQRTEVSPLPGATVCLTIDMHIQYLLEQALQEAVNYQNAKSAWGVVQEVKTGRILGMASLPSFDLNTYNHASGPQKLNRVIGYTYEPGSTMKALIFAAAFNERIVNEHMEIYCEDGYWGAYRLRDFHAYGVLSVADVLKKSSNIGSAKIGLMLGEKRLERYLRAFGIGRPTGIELPGEEAGIFHPRNRWDGLTITRVPIGHAVSVTALQMVAAYSAIANDGFLIKPRIVDRIVGPDGEIVREFSTEVVGRPIREDAARTIRHLLKRVAEPGGTARRAQIEGYEVAGKTGTAEKPHNGGYSSSANIASFVGFLPAENPEISLLIVIDEPQRAHTGGAVAAPVFRDLGTQLVRYLHVPPSGLGPNEQWAMRNEVQTSLFRVE
jgi:cell division protein FtsI (penicillin-binding protein 3)